MATDVISAPLAELDGKEWQEFNDFSLLSTLQDVTNESDLDNTSCRLINDMKYINNERTISEMVCACQNGISQCFPTISNCGPTVVSCQQDLVNDSRVWCLLSSTFDAAPQIEWSQMRARGLQEKCLNLQMQKESNSSDPLDVSDDEELQQAMDLHSLITLDHEDEPLASADQVISEIEQMMEDDLSSSDSCGTYNPKPPKDIIRQKLKQASVPSGMSLTDGVATLSVSELAALTDELEATVRCYSETLVTELAHREEQEFLKELNNQFISLLLSIQRRRREMAVVKSNPCAKQCLSNNVDKKKIGKLVSFGATKKENSETEGMYLTTVIPYNPHQGPPGATELQIYIKIMTAIVNDNPSVPNLLTDYILKVLCPTT